MGVASAVVIVPTNLLSKVGNRPTILPRIKVLRVIQSNIFLEKKNRDLYSITSDAVFLSFRTLELVLSNPFGNALVMIEIC